MSTFKHILLFWVMTITAGGFYTAHIMSAKNHYYVTYAAKTPVVVDTATYLDTLPLSTVDENKLTKKWKQSTDVAAIKAERYRDIVTTQLEAYTDTIVPPEFILAFMTAESQVIMSPKNHANACGFMQITPIAIAEIKRLHKIDVSNACTSKTKNIFIGVAYTIYLIETYKITNAAVLAAAYNEGGNGVKKYIKTIDNHRHAQRVAYAFKQLTKGA